MSSSDPRQAILDSIRILVEELRQSSRTVERKLGISGAQLFVLQQLGAVPAGSLNELAERTLTHQSSVSVVVARLEKKRLVERTPSGLDRRRLEIRLTEKGRRLLARAPSPIQERILDSIGAFSGSERRKLAELLQEMNLRAGIGGKAVPLFFEGESK
jgi:DNA-binding MarR family transcriptional regulator